MKQFSGKVALITGSTRGLGKEIAYELARKGAAILMHGSKNSIEAQKSFKELLKISTKSCLYFADLKNYEEIDKMAKDIKKNKKTIDILVNNAGITRSSSFLKMTREEWESVMSVNVTGTFYVSKLLIPLMLKNKGGRVINIASVYGFSPEFGQTNYATSKAALVGFTKALAQEMAKYEITVNAVCPGITEVGMVHDIPKKTLTERIQKIPLGRIGKKEEIAKLVVFLAGPDSSYITGQAIHINGGMY